MALGWAGYQWVPSAAADWSGVSPRWPELVAVSRALHAALAGVTTPSWRRSVENPWTIGDAVACGERDPGPLLGPAAGPLAGPDESRDIITGLYRRAWRHADATIAALPLDAEAKVPWWGETATTTLGRILVHMTAEAQRHAGHADIVRELIDGSVGLLKGAGNMTSCDAGWWRDYRDQVERAAQAAGS